MAKQLNLIDLFCGAGGFSLGFEQAGFESVLAIDKWANYRHCLLRQWGSNELNGRMINYDYIRQNINILYRDFDYE